MKQIFKKVTSTLVAFALLLTCLPLSIFAVGAASTPVRQADAPTLDAWKDLFWTTPLSTASAGRVWTDKSVLTNAAAFAGTGITQDDPESFLVALSAIGSSMSITGSSASPTDTVLILDVSGSMDDSTGRDSEMVRAANRAIGDLLAQNPHNRICVVLYASTGSVFLPLDRYTTTSTTQEGRETLPSYIYLSNQDRVSIASGVRNSSNRRPSATARTVEGGTYIQDGLFAACETLTASSVSTTVSVGSSTVNRTPVIVLMSDGEPTFATNSYNAVGNSNIGQGYTSDATSDMAFLTQLTAAWVKAKVAQKYSASTPQFYTLGLGVGRNSLALSVMDPLSPGAHADTVGYWRAFSEAAEGASIRLNNSPYYSHGWKYRTVTKLNDGINDGTDTLVLSRDYVDDYILSTDAGGLAEAFGTIVEKIELRSKSYPTLVVQNEDLSGYVSFVDRVGDYMQVTDVKGVLIHNTLFSGADLASNFVAGGGRLGTFDHPTALGHEMVAAVRARLGLSTDDEARTLIGLAYDAGQIAYNAETGEFSNFIGWQADADGKYLGFWKKGITTLHEDAVFAVKSYGYLGAVDEEHGVAESDMMYMTVQVRTNLKTGEEIVTLAVPAALLPVVNYSVTLDENGDPTELSLSGAQHPIRLVYEVALDEKLNPFTLQDLVSDDYLANNTAPDGSVRFYANRFERDHTTGYGKSNTYAYFNPARSNDRYYFTEDAVVYSDENGTLYTAFEKPSGTMYRKMTVYEQNGSAVTAKTVYRRFAEASLDTARREGNAWVVPAGSVHVNLSGMEREKSPNATGTLPWSSYPFVDTKNHALDDTGYFFYVGATLGNNGVASMMPETGIKLQKQMAVGTAEPNELFAFVLENGTDPDDSATYPALFVYEGGVQEATEVRFENGRARVLLGAGMTLYIGGMTEGESFLLYEEETADYVVETINGQSMSSLTLVTAEGEMQSAVFVNAVRGKGDFALTKEVLHSLGRDYELPEDLSFEMTVTFRGVGTASASFAAKKTNDTLTSVSTDEHGSFAVSLKAEETLHVYGLPEGTQVTVVESAPGAGFTAAYYEEEILGDGVVTVAENSIVSVKVKNTYVPDPVDPINLEVGGTKHFVDEAGNDAVWGSSTFTVRLERYGENGWELVEEVTLSDAKKTFSFDLSGEEYDKVGVYAYQVIEVEPAVGSTERPSGVFYDSVWHTFSVYVSDEEMDGELEIVRVHSEHANRDFPSVNGTYEVTTDFTNVQHVTSPALAVVEVQKRLENDAQSPAVSLSGYEFGLYTDAECTTEVTDAVDGVKEIEFSPTDSVGEGWFDIVFDKIGDYTFYVQEIKGANDRMTYSDQVVRVDVSVRAGAGGTLVAEVSYDTQTNADGELEFTNVYLPTPATLELDFAQKSLVGREMKDGEEFTFVLEDEDHNPVTSGKSVGGVDADGDSNAEIVFEDALTFEKVGSYLYFLRETSPSERGVSADATVYLIRVHVTDEAGSLKAKYSVENLVADEILFVNRYEAAPVSYALSGTKELVGRRLVNEEFSFMLVAAEANGAAKPASAAMLAKNGTDGVFTFPEITYTKAGTYHYRITERTADSSASWGVEYDETKFFASILVSDDGLGRLFVEDVTYREIEETALGGVANEIRFVNRYEASAATVTISGKKDMVGRELSGEDFSFELYESNTAWEKLGAPETVKNDASGKFSFEEITYETPGSYYYVVCETDGGAQINGVTYDDAVYYVRVDVEDDLVGTLQTEIYLYDAEKTPQQMIVFLNEYEIRGSETVTFSGEKTLEGRTAEDGEFTFYLYETDADYDTEGKSVVQSAQNVSDAYSISVDYGTEDVGETFYYVLLEKNAGETLSGVTYDQTRYEIEVAVRDDGVGGIETEVQLTNTSKGVADLDFTNRYEAAGAPFELTGEKELSGRTLQADEFCFLLSETDGAHVPVTNGISLAAQNEADGTFSFGEILLTEAKTYYFTVEEQDTAAERVTYDTSVYYVTVEVTDDGLGQLSAGTPVVQKVGDAASGDLRFENVFTPKPDDVSVTLAIEKTVDNRGSETISAEGFVFFLEEGDDRLLATSDETGHASFTLTFTEDDLASPRVFTLYEVDTGEAHVTYDETVYEITATVTLNANNELCVLLTLGGEESDGVFAFENVYDDTPESGEESDGGKKDPQKDPGQNPQGPAPMTGDATNHLLLAALLFVATSGALVTGAKRKKTSEE